MGAKTRTSSDPVGHITRVIPHADALLARRLSARASVECRERTVRRLQEADRRAAKRVRRIETSGARMAEQMGRFRTKLDMPKPSAKTAFSRLLTVTAALQAVRARGKKA